MADATVPGPRTPVWKELETHAARLSSVATRELVVGRREALRALLDGSGGPADGLLASARRRAGDGASSARSRTPSR